MARRRQSPQFANAPSWGIESWTVINRYVIPIETLSLNRKNLLPQRNLFKLIRKYYLQNCFNHVLLLLEK